MVSIRLDLKFNKSVLFQCLDDANQAPSGRPRPTRSRARPRVSHAQPRVERRTPLAPRASARAHVRAPRARASIVAAHRRRRQIFCSAHVDDDAPLRASARGPRERCLARQNETVRRSRARRRARRGRARALEGGLETSSNADGERRVDAGRRRTRTRQTIRVRRDVRMSDERQR